MMTVRPSYARYEPPVVAALLCVIAFAVRWPQFGNPIAGLDEQFYLLVGDRMLHGAVPYLDIWDRKPLGLFLIYAAIRLLPGDGILAYQIVATCFLATTAAIVATIARRAVPPAAALFAGIIVIAYARLIGEGFGEAPIFYDLLTAVSVWCVLAVRDAPAAARAWWLAAAAMLSCGVALTVKTVAIFESAALGLLLLCTCCQAGEHPGRLARRAGYYAALGIAPTLAIAAWYAATGAFQAFWFANVQSVALRTGGLDHDSILRLVATAALLSPLIVLALLGGRRSAGSPDDRMVHWTWLAANGIGFCATGFFNFHYALPMIAPLAILAVPALRSAWTARLLLAVAAGWVIFTATGSTDGRRRDRADLAAIVRALPADVAKRCLLVVEGPVILYHLAHACLVTPYVFPGHLSAPGEAHALGRPRDDIMRDALARRPAVIVTGTASTDRALNATLARAYRPATPTSIRLYGGTRAEILVWRRRP